MKLYETTIELEKLWNEAEHLLDSASEEFNNEAALRDVEAKMKLVESEQKTLALHIATIIKNQRAETYALEVEREALDARVKRSIKKEEWLETYLQTFVPSGSKIADSRVTISWRKSKSVEVLIDVEDLPAKYQKINITTKPDKQFIKEMLEVGDPDNELQGKAKIVEKDNIQIK
jgi:hypothetical protein